MTAAEFPEVTHRIAEDQPEYITLPAHYNPREGSLTFCFDLNKEELDEIAKTGKIWFKQITGGNAMQPIILSTLKSDLIQ
jgi:hypothetical protein